MLTVSTATSLLNGQSSLSQNFQIIEIFVRVVVIESLCAHIHFRTITAVRDSSKCIPAVGYVSYHCCERISSKRPWHACTKRANTAI